MKKQKRKLNEIEGCKKDQLSHISLLLDFTAMTHLELRTKKNPKIAENRTKNFGGTILSMERTFQLKKYYIMERTLCQN